MRMRIDSSHLAIRDLFGKRICFFHRVLEKTFSFVFVVV